MTILLTWQHVLALFILAIPIACVARTVVYEEVFREPREFCQRKSQTCRTFLARKFFYLFTCEYCFSHWVTAFFLALSALGPGEGFKLLFADWRGYVISFFSLLFVANAYLNLYARLRVDITSEKKAIEVKEQEIEASKKEIQAKDIQLARLEAELPTEPVALRR
jgi:hypothetical protein